MVNCKSLSGFISFRKKAEVLRDALLVFVGHRLRFPYRILLDEMDAEIFQHLRDVAAFVREDLERALEHALRVGDNGDLEVQFLESAT